MTLPYDRPPLSMNDRLHYRAEAKIKADLREATRWLIRHAGIPPLNHIQVALVWTVPDRRSRDTDNPLLTAKTCVDAIVDAGVIPNDTPEYITRDMTHIIYSKGERRLELTITEVI